MDGHAALRPARMMLAAGALLAMTAVAAGAFGAHALRGSLAPERLAIFDTATRYQFYHAAGLLIAGLLALQQPGRLLSSAAIMFGLGILFFCGSLYALTLSGLRMLGAIAPVGGACFMLGWLLIALAAWRWRFVKDQT